MAPQLEKSKPSPVYSFDPAVEYPLVFQSQNRANIYGLWNKSRPVTTLSVLPRVIQTTLLPLKAAFIGSVHTLARYRNKGLSKRCFRYTFKELEKEEFDCAILWSDQVSFYQKLGFSLFGLQKTLSDIPPLHALLKPARCEEIRFFTTSELESGERERVSSDILRLYQQHACTVERAQHEISKLLLIPNMKIGIVCENNTAVAYAVFEKGIDFPHTIHEWSGDTDAVLRIAAQFQKTPCPQELKILCAPFKDDISKRLETLAATVSLEYLGHIKLIQPKRTLKAIGERSGFDCDLDIGHGRFSLKVDGHELTFQGTLETFVFGPDRPKLLTPDVPKSLLAKLNTTFPIVFFIWGLDSI